jgi:hypothetical protein
MNKKLQGLEKNINELQGQKKRHAKRHLLTSEDSPEKMNLLATDARLETDELQATSILDLNTD